MLVSLKVARLAALWSPYNNGLWGQYILSRKHVAWCQIHGMRVAPGVVTPFDDGSAAFLTHAMRVAWLMTAPRLDPLKITVASDVWPIRDGNHRLGAAIALGLEEVKAVYTGDAGMLAILDGSAPAPWKAAEHPEDEYLFAGAWWEDWRKGQPQEWEVLAAVGVVEVL